MTLGNQIISVTLPYLLSLSGLIILDKIMRTQETEILGSKYKIIFANEDEVHDGKFPHLFRSYGSLLSPSRVILIRDFDDELPLATAEEGGADNNFIPLRNSALRHEILHAYLNECGLRFNANSTGDKPWSRNEEMIDWFAWVSPKIFNTYSELGILND